MKVAQSCLTLCDHMDYTVHGILQARILEWVAFPFSRGLPDPGGFFTSWATRETQEYWSGNLSLLQWIFPTQELNQDLLHCRQILYQLSHKESPRILDWVDYPFFSGSSRPRNRTGVSCIADGFFTNWAIMEAPHSFIIWLQVVIRSLGTLGLCQLRFTSTRK